MSGFQKPLPLWLWIHPAQPPARQPFVTLNATDGGMGTALFTDRALADHFKRSIPGMADYELVVIDTPKRLLAFLEAFEEKGFGRVLVDPTLNGGVPILIRQIREAIAAAPG